jgi:hypothetical protein
MFDFVEVTLRYQRDMIAYSSEADTENNPERKPKNLHSSGGEVTNVQEKSRGKPYNPSQDNQPRISTFRAPRSLFDMSVPESIISFTPFGTMVSGVKATQNKEFVPEIVREIQLFKDRQGRSHGDDCDFRRLMIELVWIK